MENAVLGAGRVVGGLDMPDATRAGRALACSEAELGLALDDVVVALSSNEAYVPYLSVVIQSLCENATSRRRYDIVVMTSDVTPESAEALRAQVAGFNDPGAPARFAVGFLDTRPALENVHLFLHNRFGAEAHFRLLAPDLLPSVRKVAYLDADLVVLHDVAELFDVDVEGCLVAAMHDPDTEGQIAGYDPMVRPYLEQAVGLQDLGTYFQSGVLLLNLEEFRRSHPTSEMLELASSQSWRWPDQDILNRLAQGRYVRLDPRWNVLHDWEHLRRSHIVAQACEETRAAYDASRRDPWVVHYAGPDNRPWLYPRTDMGDYFWDYAARCPFYDELRARLRASYRQPRALGKRAFLYAIYKWGLPAVDAVFPVGTRRRAAVLSVYERLGGQCT